MRVASLVTSFPAPTETFVLDQLTGLLARGIDVEVLPERLPVAGPVHREVAELGLSRRVFAPPELPRGKPSRALGAALLALRGRPRPGVLVRSLNSRRHGHRARSLRLLHEAAGCVGRGPYDLLHAHFGPNGLRGLQLREIGALEGRLIVTFYGWDVGLCQADPAAYARLLGRADGVLALSEEMRSRLLDLWPTAPVIVHRLGVDLNRYSPPAVGRPRGRPLEIISLARLVPKKGLADAIQAVARLVADGRMVRYRIFGSGPLEAELRRSIASLGLEGSVFLEGERERDRISELLQQSDLLLAPSVAADGDREGTPVAILEALATAVPVVATRHAGIPELVADGESGYLVAEGDVAALAERIARLADRPDLRAAMGRAGRQRVARRHELERQTDRLVEIYRAALQTS